MKMHLVSMGYRWQKRHLEGHVLHSTGLRPPWAMANPSVSQSAYLILVTMDFWHWTLPTKQFQRPLANTQDKCWNNKLHKRRRNFMSLEWKAPCRGLTLGSWLLIMVTVVEHSTIFPEVLWDFTCISGNSPQIQEYETNTTHSHV